MGLKVHRILISAINRQLATVSDNILQLDNLPLKVFVRCSECGQPMTGYYMKKKKVHYYKCRTIGCKLHKNAEKLNAEFRSVLERYTLTPSMLKLFRFHVEHVLNDGTADNIEAEKVLKLKLTEVEKKIFNIEEQFYALREMPKEKFDKYQPQYEAERKEILEGMGKIVNPISDYAETVNKISEVILKASDIWDNGGANVKDKVQKLIFPNGIEYNRNNGSFLTKDVNPFFELIPQLHKVVGSNKKGTPPFLKMKSPLAERGGFEPPVRCWAYDSLANCSFRPLRHLSCSEKRNAKVKKFSM